jgi:hypothetical protein|tara:strand:+ start:242 stop:415 length:174 start_codon:yes stop_codon:yes gene_type:complete
MSNSLWGKMWSESSFVPADPVQKIDRLKEEPSVMDYISKLERRIQVLENRLNRLNKI